MVLPFSLFYRAERHTYYVVFKNKETGRYLSAISTKQKDYNNAVKQAWVWYRKGIPNKGGTLDIKTFSMRDAVHRSDISPADAEFIIGELMRRGLILFCAYAGASDSVRFVDFLDVRAMADWATKGTIPAADTLFSITEFLGCTVEYLLSGAVIMKGKYFIVGIICFVIAIIIGRACSKASAQNAYDNYIKQSQNEYEEKIISFLNSIKFL
jgi:hypothetical protein